MRQFLACTYCAAIPQDTQIFAGKNGALCKNCLGKVFQQIAHSLDRCTDLKGISATTRCLLCDETAPKAKTVIYTPPWCLCDECLSKLFNVCLENSESNLLKVIDLSNL